MGRGGGLWPSSVFARSLLVRLILAVVFSCSGYLGSGGDPEAYHMLGRYLLQRWEDPGHADLGAIVEEAGFEELEHFYDIHVDNVERWGEWDGVGHYLNTVMPIVVVHALSYAVWDHPFSFVLVTSVVSALAVARAVRAFGLSTREARWLVWNPVSLYYAATHFKESFSESLVLMFLAALFAGGSAVRAFPWVCAMGLFRVSFAGLFGLVALMRLSVVGRMHPGVFGLGMLGLFLVLPAFNGSEVVPETGRVFSLVYGSAFGSKVLAPLVGLLLPLPCQFLFAWGSMDLWSVFSSVYGAFYYWVCAGLWRRRGVVLRDAELRRWCNSALGVSLVMGYLFLGGPGVKDRYFSGFFPLLLLAWIFARRGNGDRGGNSVADAGFGRSRGVGHERHVGRPGYARRVW